MIKNKMKLVKYIILSAIILIIAGILLYKYYFGEYSPVYTSWTSIYTALSPEDVAVIPPTTKNKELAAFSGMWRGDNNGVEYFFIVKEIKFNKALVYYHSDNNTANNMAAYAFQFDAGIRQEDGKYFLEWTMRTGKFKQRCYVTFNEDMKTLFGNFPGCTFDMEKVQPDYFIGKPSPFYEKNKAVQSADWIKSSVIYEVFPRVFTDQKGFAGLTEKLPYLKKLGVNTIWLMPIHEIGQENKKGSLGSPYSVKDYYSINHEFGSKEDFKNFITAAHQNSFRVIIDWVANHSAWDNQLVKDHPDWYTKDVKGNIISPAGMDWTDVADFDYNSKELRVYMTNAMKYWVREFRIDGFRCDAAAMVPLNFWETARAELVKINKDLLFLSESEEREHHVKGFDLTYEGATRTILKEMITASTAQSDFNNSISKMKFRFAQNSLRMHWLENHDQIRTTEYFGREEVYPAATVLLTMDGVPLLFMGQEFGDSKWLDWRSLFDSLQLEWNKFDEKLFNHYSRLISIRNSCKAFTKGTMDVITNNQPKVISYMRSYENDKYLVVINMSDSKVTARISYDDITKTNLSANVRLTNILLDNKTSEIVSNFQEKEFLLNSYESAVYKVEKMQ